MIKNLMSFYTEKDKSELIKKIKQDSHKSFTVWKEFHRQNPALDFLKTSLNFRLFSFEYDKNMPGLRRFVVSTLPDFYQQYINIKEKNFYEVIVQETPCHLYFDLEYEKCFNVNKDGNNLVCRFKEVLYM
jgi:hypothetical protein